MGDIETSGIDVDTHIMPWKRAKLEVGGRRIDAYLDYEAHIKHEAKKLKIDLDKGYQIEAAKPGSKLYVAFAKTEKSKELIRIFDSRVTQLVESGEIWQGKVSQSLSSYYRSNSLS